MSWLHFRNPFAALRFVSQQRVNLGSVVRLPATDLLQLVQSRLLSERTKSSACLWVLHLRPKNGMSTSLSFTPKLQGKALTRLSSKYGPQQIAKSVYVSEWRSKGVCVSGKRVEVRRREKVMYRRTKEERMRKKKSLNFIWFLIEATEHTFVRRCWEHNDCYIPVYL